MSTTVRNSGLNSGYIVIQDSEMSYLLPVEGEFLADAVWPSNKSRNAFLATLRKKGIARARLISEVKNGESVRARLSARFVAQLQQPG